MAQNLDILNAAVIVGKRLPAGHGPGHQVTQMRPMGGGAAGLVFGHPGGLAEVPYTGRHASCCQSLAGPSRSSNSEVPRHRDAGRLHTGSVSRATPGADEIHEREPPARAVTAADGVATTRAPRGNGRIQTSG